MSDKAPQIADSQDLRQAAKTARIYWQETLGDRYETLADRLWAIEQDAELLDAMRHFLDCLRNAEATDPRPDFIEIGYTPVSRVFSALTTLVPTLLSTPETQTNG